MPIIATPVGAGPFEPGRHAPTVTKLFDIPVPAKRRSISIPQSTCGTARVQMCSPNGDAVDLSYLKFSSYTATAAFRETLTRSGTTYLSVGEIEETGETGWIVFEVPTKVANNAGIYILEVVVTDDTFYPKATADGEVVTAVVAETDRVEITTTIQTYVYPTNAVPTVKIGDVLVAGQHLVQNTCVAISNTFYFVVERGLFGKSDNPHMGPPTLAEVRLHLRDFPETNLLLDDYEFDAAEVALAAERCVMYFNEMMPPISRFFTTNNFPYRYHWLEGITYYLYITAAAWHRRNKLPYQAGGVTVDDLSKEKEYQQAAMLHEKNWKDWSQRQKVSLNMEEGFSTFSSDYSYR